MVAELPGLNAYAKRTKWLKPRFCPKKKREKKKFLGHSRAFLPDFLFQDLSILNKEKIELDPEVVPEGQ